MSNRDRWGDRYNEIHSFSGLELDRLYRVALEVFLSIKDIEKLNVSFTPFPAGSPHYGHSLHVCDNLAEGYPRLFSFSCRLQTFPGCCGYLIMSNVSCLTCSEKIEPLIKGVFELARVLNYQTLFTTHFVTSPWFSLLKGVFKETRITGTNVRTGNKLACFVQPVAEALPVQIHEIFETPKTESKVSASSWKRLVRRTPTELAD